jgi:hypothetical protein
MTMPEEKLSEIPDPAAFFLKTGLYTPFNLDPEKILAIEEHRDTLDLYCVECQQISVFKTDLPPKVPDINARAPAISPSVAQEESHRKALRQRVFTVEFECSRDRTHKAYFVFKVDPESICKIGQFPSRADIEYPSLEKYRKLLGPRYAELTKAVGLAAHGIGVGSFVYLRRIFERLIEEAAQERLQEDPAWGLAQWRTQHMDEKIGELASYLPAFLVQNKSIYSILSKGIHELGEEECMKHFDVVKGGIQLILNERVAEMERRKAQRLIHGGLARIKGELS